MTDVFRKLVEEYPETFKYSVRLDQLDIVDCPWNIARIEHNMCKVHDFTQNTISDFDPDWARHIAMNYESDVVLNFGALVTVCFTEPQNAYDAILKSAWHHEFLIRQARVKYHNERVEQALKNLD